MGYVLQGWGPTTGDYSRFGRGLKKLEKQSIIGLMAINFFGGSRNSKTAKCAIAPLIMDLGRPLIELLLLLLLQPLNLPTLRLLRRRYR